jgi:hypothetical protein
MIGTRENKSYRLGFISSLGMGEKSRNLELFSDTAELESKSDVTKKKKRMSTTELDLKLAVFWSPPDHTHLCTSLLL